MNTTVERIEYVKRRIEERRSIAADLRADAIGASINDAANRLRDAQVCEAVAEGMQRALSMLFG